MEPSESFISMAQVTDELEVSDDESLSSWLKKLHIKPHKNHGTNGLTQEEFQRLKEAVYLHRSLTWREHMGHRLDALEARLDELDRRNELEARLGERLDELDRRYQRQLQQRGLIEQHTLRMLMSSSGIPKVIHEVADYIEDATRDGEPGMVEIALSPALEAALGNPENDACVDRWRDSWRSAMARGWAVRHFVCQINSETDVRVAQGFVTSIPRFFHERNNYEPNFYSAEHAPADMWACETVGSRTIADGYIAVTGKEPLILSVTEPALAYLAPAASELAADVRRRLDEVNDRAYSFFVRYTPEHPAYLSLIGDTEHTQGSRGVFMRGLGQTTLPLTVHTARMEQLVATYPHLEQRIRNIHAAHRSRIEHLDDKLRRWKREHARSGRRWTSNAYFIRDICTCADLDRYVRTGILSLDDNYGHLDDQHTPQPIAPEHINDHLEHLIARLETYPHYQLALFDDTQPSMNPLKWSPYWMVAEGHSVILEVLDSSGPQGETDLLIRDKALVQAFHAFFMELWEHGEHMITDQGEVVKRLRRAQRNINDERAR